MPYRFVANTDILRRMFLLRNAMLVIAVLVILAAVLWLGIDFPFLVVTGCLLVMTVFNGWVLYRLHFRVAPVQENELFLNLAFDVSVLAVIVFYTGGTANPFISLFIIPVVISVTVLPRRYAWWLVILTVVLYSLLMFFYIPLPEGFQHETHTAQFSGHLVGMWIAFVLSAGIAAQFIYSMGETLRRQQLLLAQARERDLRDQKLVTLGTLAASTAHEMGTPLGSMRLLVSEIRNELVDVPEQVSKDLNSLHVQVDRCSKALADLSVAAGQAHLLGGNVVAVDVFMQELLDEWSWQREGLTMRCDWVLPEQASINILSDQSLKHALLNILNNAADAGAEDLLWQAEIVNGCVLVMSICDRGQGMTEEMRATIGRQPFSTKDTGMGLGLFLAFAVIERFGGAVEMLSREGGGLCCMVELPLQSGDV